MAQTLVEEGGQVVLIRKLRERYGIGPGMLVVVKSVSTIIIKIPYFLDSVSVTA
jgi:bifunctional DNA-binding transcriptional regulator/antitoxin component of YhaV-PrlF toxin-antitoxin module